MQEVHEGAYDFTRFTLSGHRWLFRHFEQINAGVVNGPGVALVWSIRYLSRALGTGEAVARLVSLPFFWLRYLDRLTRGRDAADGASGVFFLGRRSEARLSPKAMPNYYEQQQSGAWRHRGRESLVSRALSLGGRRETASKTRSRRLPQP